MTDLDPRWWDSPVFRRYKPEECGKDGYPAAWSKPVGVELPIKDLVRELAEHRCIRCGHPYVVGQESLWSEPPRDDEQAVQAMALFEAEPVDEPRVKRERPVHWSPCDERCLHTTGPLRWRVGDRWRYSSDLPGDTRVLVAQGAEPQAAWRILTVHHLDGDKANCLWWNLVALCQRCHLSVQSRVQMDYPWPWEHSDWFRPYVAGYYASKYEGRDLITRREAEAEMDRLLEHERGRYELRARTTFDQRS